VANITSTLGYLASLSAVTAQCLMPRGRFVKIMTFILLSTCLAAALCCLACYTAVVARRRTGGQGGVGEGRTTTYNSDACAVSGVWLIAMIW
jgi:hypothetical protein